MTACDTMSSHSPSQHLHHSLMVDVSLQMRVLPGIHRTRKWQSTQHGATNVVRSTLSQICMNYCWNQICLNTQKKLAVTNCKLSHTNAGKHMPDTNIAGDCRVGKLSGGFFWKWYKKRLTRWFIQTPFKQYTSLNMPLNSFSLSMLISWPMDKYPPSSCSCFTLLKFTTNEVSQQ